QMFLNKDDWPAVAPYRYAGETISEEVATEDIIGEYKFINHQKDNAAALNKSQSIRLNEEQTISGAVAGTCSKDDYYADINMNDMTEKLLNSGIRLQKAMS